MGSVAEAEARIFRTRSLNEGMPSRDADPNSSKRLTVQETFMDYGSELNKPQQASESPEVDQCSCRMHFCHECSSEE